MNPSRRSAPKTAHSGKRAAEQPAAASIGRSVVSSTHLTLTEVAEILGLRIKTVAEYARRGELVGRRIGRRWIFAEEAVDAFLEEMPQWLYERQPRGLNGECRRSAPGDGNERSSSMRPPLPNPKLHEAADLSSTVGPRRSPSTVLRVLDVE